MKKTIFAIVMAAIVGLFAVSCSKTNMNSSKLIGTWRVDSVSFTEGGITHSESYSGDNNLTIQFVKDGTYIFTASGKSNSVSYKGTWVVIEDSIVMTVDTKTYYDLSGTWTIATLNAKSLVVTHLDDDGSQTISMSKL